MPDRATSPSSQSASSSKSTSPKSDPIAESMADNSPTSLWARLIITPLTFLSFLLSLSLIDSWTTSRLSPSSHRPPTLRQRLTNLLHRLLFKQNPSYTYPPASTSSSSSPTKPKGSGDIKGEKAKLAKEVGEHWYWHTHQRKLMRMEVDDAFRIRRWVLVVMCVTAVVFSGVSLWAGMKVVGHVVEVMGTRGSAGVRAVEGQVRG